MNNVEASNAALGLTAANSGRIDAAMTMIDLDGKSDREILVLLVMAVNGITERLDGLNGTCRIHNERIGVVENWRSKFLGAGILAVVVLPIITALAIKALS